MKAVVIISVLLGVGGCGPANAAIIKLLCKWREVECIYAPDCGKRDSDIYTIDMTRKLVDDRHNAQISEDYVSWSDGPATFGINRKTGDYHESIIGKSGIIEKRGNCSIAPENKF